MISKMSVRAAAVAAAVALAAQAGATAQEQPSGPPFEVTYADVADLADSAPLVVRAQLRRLARVEDARVQGVRAGWGRFYMEARTKSLLTGDTQIGEALAFLADLPLDERGRPPAVRRKDVLLFARTVPSRPGELTLVAPDALLLWDESVEARLRGILSALVAPDAPPRITGVREIIHVPGNLAGEGDTQIFLSTGDGSAASLTVERRAGEPPRWGASFSELTADIGNAPQPDTLAWYRLACFLPTTLPPGVNLSEDEAARIQAENDYRLIVDQLGACARSRR